MPEPHEMRDLIRQGMQEAADGDLTPRRFPSAEYGRQASGVWFTQQDREDMANILRRHGIRVTPKRVTEFLDLLLPGVRFDGSRADG